jgi:hypothetical protein
MGVVELAAAPDGTRVALKRIAVTGSAAAQREARTRLRREAEVLGHLDHPGIVALLDVVVDGDDLVLVMPWLQGGSLADRVAAGGPLPAAEVEGLADHLLGALAAAHRAGVVHRDVKPSNVLFDGQGRPYLTDFGVATARDATAGLTVTGGAVGTPAFLAPEQARGEAVGPAADVFALGATLRWAATGAGPWGDGRTDVVLWRASRGRLTRPPRHLPASLRALLDATLDPRPERRPTAAALRGGADGTAVRPTAARRPPAAALGHWRRPALAAGSVLAAGVVVVGGLTVGRGADGSVDDTVDVDPTTTTACVAWRYRPCGAAAAPGTDGRRCVEGRVDLDDDPIDGCEAEPDALADGTVVDRELTANLVPADDVDTYTLDVDDGFQLLCDGRITVTLIAPPATTMRVVLLDPEGEVRGEAVSADGSTGEVVFRERDCGGDEAGPYAVRVSLVAGSAASAEYYTLTESGSL